MKKAFVVFFLLTMVSVAVAQTGTVNMSGLWFTEVAGTRYTITIFHKGNKIAITDVGKPNNTLSVTYGVGTVKNNTFEYDYDFAFGPQGWLPGHVSGVVSPDGKTITIKYRDTGGNGGTQQLTRSE